MRLIDADALVASLKQKYCADCPALFGCDCSFDDDLRDINNAPTIDAVPVVRCEECCYWQPPTYQEQEDGSTVGHCTAALNGQQTDAYWFCADGKRW